MTTDIDVWPGTAYPLGATFDGGGTNFALFSEVAERVDLCLVDPDGTEVRIEVREVDAHVWHCYLPHVQPGQRYGYRVHGPYEPEKGLRCNPAKLLLDPYAKATDREIDWHPSVFGYDFEEGPGVPQRRGLRPAHDARRGHQPVLRLGGRPPAQRALQRVGHLRGARQGPHPAAPRRTGGAARHVRRPRPPGDHRAPDPARGDRDRADARPPVRAGQHAAGEGPAQLLGLQHAGVLRAARRLRRQHRRTASRCRSSRPWSRPCTRPASR